MVSLKLAAFVVESRSSCPGFATRKGLPRTNGAGPKSPALTGDMRPMYAADAGLMWLQAGRVSDIDVARSSKYWRKPGLDALSMPDTEHDTGTVRSSLE